MKGVLLLAGRHAVPDGTRLPATLALISKMPPGSRVVFDYAVEKSSLNVIERIALKALSDRVAKAGEPFQLFFNPEALNNTLHGIGFRHVEDLGAGELNSRYFYGRADGLQLRGRLGRLVSAGN